jgi:hypothetical protein
MPITTQDLFIGEEGDLHRDLGGGESVTLAPAAELGLPVEMVWIMPTLTAAGALADELQKVGHRFAYMTDDTLDQPGVVVVTVTTREGMYAGGYGAAGFDELAAKYGGVFDGHGTIVRNPDHLGAEPKYSAITLTALVHVEPEGFSQPRESRWVAQDGALALSHPGGPREYWRGRMVGKLVAKDGHLLTDAEYDAVWNAAVRDRLDDEDDDFVCDDCAEELRRLREHDQRGWCWPRQRSLGRQ